MEILDKIKQRRLEKNLKNNQKVTSVMENKNWKGKNALDKYIYSEVLWDKSNKKHLFKRYNIALQKEDSSILPSISSSTIGHYLRTPLIAMRVRWRTLIAEKFDLLSYRIEFTNYNSDPFVYSVVLEAIKKNGRQVCDSFYSTNSEFISADELLDNIIRFLRFAEQLKK